MDWAAAATITAAELTRAEEEEDEEDEEEDEAPARPGSSRFWLLEAAASEAFCAALWGCVGSMI